MAKLPELRNDLRPREKLFTKGVEALTDVELLMSIIGSGNAKANVAKIARELIKILKEHQTFTTKNVRSVTGVGVARATQLTASFELAKRYLLNTEQPIINSPEKAAEQLAFIRNKKQEYFVCLTLDGANRLIAKRVITIGTLTSSLVHPREVFADAIADRAASIVVGHNHPSGSTTPSKEDLSINIQLCKAGSILDIPILAHIILTPDKWSLLP